MIADIFSRQRFATVLFDGGHPRDPGVAKLLGINPKAASGAEVTTRSVLGLSAVFRGVNIIGNGVAKCRPLIYQRLNDRGEPDPEGRDKRRAMEHPAWRSTVRRANPWMSAGTFRKTLTLAAILRGNGIGHVERDGAGRVLEYTPLLPDRTGMAVFGAKLDETGQLPVGAEVLYWTLVGGQMRTILPENIIHIRGLSHNGVWGVDVIEVMRETLGLAIAARDCGARFYGQGMLGSGILYMPSGLGKGPKGEETVANFIKSVKEQAQGLSRSHRMIVVDEGAKFEKLSVDPEGAQALQTREFEIREIANIIGVQPHKLGDTKRTSYASLEQSNQEHLDDDLDPWISAWEEALEDTALTEQEKETGSHYVECNRKGLLRTNLAARATYYTQARNGGWMSANDIRRAEGEDPIGPQGDTYLQPLNMTAAGGSGSNVVDANGDQQAAAAERELLAARGASQLPDLVRALALHECHRLVKRTCDEAVRRAAKGGGEFVAFLDTVPTWCGEPAPIAGLLGAVGGHLVAELNKFTESPYAAADLKTNIAAAIDSIRERALAFAGEEFETGAHTQRRAAA